MPIDDASFIAGATAGGLPSDYAQMLAGLFQAVRGGSASLVSPDVQKATGQAPRTFDAYAKEHAAQFARKA